MESTQRHEYRSSLDSSRVKTFGAIFKKKAFRASEKLQARVEERTTEFLNEIKEINPEKLVFLDEAGVHLGMTRTRARAVIGHRAACYLSRNTGGNISLIGAVRLAGMCALHPYDGPIDGERFLDFLGTKLLPNLNVGDVLVMDNLRVHHISAAKEMAQQRGIQLLYLPPYSPELNPIEEVWSLIKRIFRSAEARTIAAFIDAMHLARDAVTAGKIENLFKHAGYVQF